MAQPGPPHRKINDPVLDNERNWDWLKNHLDETQDVTGLRNDPESALASLLAALEAAGIITDSTDPS